MLNVLITGASGMLGATLVNEYKKDFNIFATGNSSFREQYVHYKEFDLRSKSYQELIRWANPDIIIHCGALTNGNLCEKNPEDALNINALSVQKFLDATNKHVRIIFISTDAVFSSSQHLANEQHSIEPESVYGKTKEVGEFFLNITEDRSYVIIRTTIVGLNLNNEKHSFVEWIISSAKNHEKFGLFTDVVFCPISIWDLADEIRYIIDNNINRETLHIAGELCSKFEFGEKLLQALEIRAEMLTKSLITSFETRAKRSSDQSLDTSYYRNNYNRRLPTLNETISNIKNHYECD